MQINSHINALKKKWNSEEFRKQSYTSLSVVAFLGLLLASLIKPDLNLPPDKPEGSPDFSFEGVKITFYEGEKKLWHLSANKAAIYNDQDVATLVQAKGQLFNEEKPYILFYAPSGRININNSNMTLFDSDSIISTEKGTVSLFSKELSWNEHDKSFEGKGFNRITQGPISLEGQTFFVNLPVKKLSVANSARAIIKGGF